MLRRFQLPVAGALALSLLFHSEPVRAQPAGDDTTPSEVSDPSADKWKPGKSPNSIRAVRRKGAISIDGRVDEKAWEGAQWDRRFYNHNSKPRYEQVDEIGYKVLYDNDNLYLAIETRYDDPSKIKVATDVQDWFNTGHSYCINVDTTGDGEAAYNTCLSISNFRATGQAVERGRKFEGWQAPFNYKFRVRGNRVQGEIAFPWNSIGITGDHAEPKVRMWVSNLRLENGNRTQSPHDAGMLIHLPSLANVTGIKDLKTKSGIRFGAALILKYVDPGYDLPRVVDWTGSGDKFEARASFDANIPLGKSMTAQLTFAPDFSDAALDSFVANLTPFAFFFPERRAFFLQRPDIFLFGEPFVNQLFYSRRIGLLPNGRENPILGGGLILGSSGGNDFGVIVSQTAQLDASETGGGFEQPSQNDVVVRTRHFLADQQLRVGTMFTQRLPFSDDSQASRSYGVDLQGRAANDRLNTIASVATTVDGEGHGYSVHGGISWNTRLIQAQSLYTFANREFRPALGFYRFLGAQRYFNSFNYTPNIPKPMDRLNVGVQQQVVTGTDSSPIETTNTLILGTSFLNGAYWEAKATSVNSQLRRRFNPVGGVVYEAGDYNTSEAALSVATPPQKMLQANINFTNGGLYSGGKRQLQGGLVLTLPKFSLATRYQIVRLFSPSEDLDGDGVLGEFEDLDGDGTLDRGVGRENIISGVASYTHSWSLNFSVSAQASTDNDNFQANFRGSWEYSPFNFVKLVAIERTDLRDVFGSPLSERLVLLKLSHNTFSL